jgi:pilus assembly protein Flp/PilA
VSDRAEGRSTAELGASGVEYGILIAAIAALIIGVVFVLGQFVHDNYKTACTNLQSQMAGDECPP